MNDSEWLSPSASVQDLEPETRSEDALQHAAWSLLLPGLGQVGQRRYGAALLQFGTVVVYAASAFGLGGRRAMLLALLWNLWSAVDAYRSEAD